MLFIRVFFSTILVSLFSFQILYSQTNPLQCATDPSSIQDVGQLRATTWTLKILLVEFSDVEHNTTPSYTYSNFNNLFFSTNVYVSPNMYSPDGEPVSGSMRDYYSIMSDGEFNLTGHVVNPDENQDGVPDWLTLPLRKGQYDSVGFANWDPFLAAVVAAANSAGIDISTNSTTKLAVIYAGHTYRGNDTLGTGSGLNPQAGYYGGKHLYIHGEKFACCSPARTERPDAKFAEIGINAHEFGHLLGFPDLYDNGGWDMMNAGPTLGPNFRGACPAPLNPQTRYLKGWLSFDPVTSNHTSQADYYLRDPEIFQIKSTDPRYYWLIETRNFSATMTIGTTTTQDYNYYLLRSYYTNAPNQGVLVWKVDTLLYRWGSVLHADGKQWPDWPYISAGDQFPGTGNVKVLSPWSDSRTYPDYVPNTKPSTNVGMEITSEGNGYYMIDFYNSSPQNASPSKPQTLHVAPYNGNPKLTWTKNQEPDVTGGAAYRVYRNSLLIGTAAQSDNPFYIDETISWNGQPYGVNTATYTVRAVDTQNLLSIFSDPVSLQYNLRLEKKSGDLSQAMPFQFVLHQNYPNPFNPATTIDYQLPADGFVSLKVYDVLGRIVAGLVDGYQSAGYYAGTWNAQAVGSGLYFYRLTVKTDDGKSFSATKKMLLTK